MKAELLTALKTEYAKSGLSDKAFDGVASVLVKTVTKEDEIDGVVKSDETKNLIKAYQTDTDKVRTEKATLQAEFDKYKKEHPETKTPPKTEEEDSETIKQMKAEIEALKLANKEKDEKAARAEKMASVRAKMKEQGSDNDNILDLVLDKAEFKDDESIDDIATRLKSDYDAKYTKFYGDGPRPLHHGKTVPEYTGTEDDDFADSLRSEGVLPKKDA
ncbi:MAG: hypothetical protein IJK99_09290 [Bacteroidales bacterium]|nr:hypothetical protein [Bacteroidales bacterium]